MKVIVSISSVTDVTVSIALTKSQMRTAFERLVQKASTKAKRLSKLIDGSIRIMSTLDEDDPKMKLLERNRISYTQALSEVEQKLGVLKADIEKLTKDL